MMPVVLFRVGAVDPVENVQRPVGTHEKHIVPGQVLHLAVALQDHQLGHDGDALEVDGERPEQFHDVEVRDSRSDQVGQKGQNGTRNGGKLPVQERVLALLVGALDRFLELDRVNDRGRGGNVDELHHRVVQRVKGGEQIQVPGDKHQQIEFVRLHGDTLGILRNSQPQQQDDDAEQVRHVAAKPKDVHCSTTTTTLSKTSTV
mmetsp:Transcript_6988/g.17537  ORF Transcript_6988/g.17537 Transcript_6988/m.17537 type:complete len:203 (-) Transcript_6988:52-660(-)